MGKSAKPSIIVGLDIGTTKICAVIAEVHDEGQIEIIGIGKAISHGLRKGVVVNLESTTKSIRQAVDEAERMAGITVDSVFAGIAGGHIKGFNSRGVIAVTGRNREITERDVERVIDAARAVAIPLDCEVLHIIPQEFIVDDQDGIKEPLGMCGVRLEAEVHIVTAAVTSAQNIVKSVNRAGFEVRDIVLEQLASAEATLTRDERELGVAVIDIGGGTTDLAIFTEGSVWHTAVIALGGDHITNDIAVGLRTPAKEAEKIKKKHGCALVSMVGEADTFEVPGVGGRPARIESRRVLAEIIEPRVEEMLSLADNEIRRTGYRDLIASGVVVTGGASLLEGLPEMAEQIFGLPVHRGYPRGVGGLTDVVASPVFATGVGLVLYGARNRELALFRNETDGHLFARVVRRMKAWFADFF
ncbi:MAG: cell division protein FtsA [Candidatus Schekmanbacteria bacterium]|nr:cell division protein FtsA [Candidatus Schekmanbacteria bacterium]